MILKILSFIESFIENWDINYFKNIIEENCCWEFRLKNIDEVRNYVLEEIDQNELMSKKEKKISKTLNYIESFLILAAAINGCISFSGFA